MIAIIPFCLAAFAVYVAYEAARFVVFMRVGELLSAKTEPYQRDKGEIKMLVLGDSSALGAGADTAEHSVAGLLSLHFNAAVENRAANRSRVADLQNQLSAVTRQTYNIILIQIGANDATHFTPLSNVEQDIDQTLRNVRRYSDNVILIMSGKIGDAPIFPLILKPLLNARTAMVRDKLRSAAQRNGVIFVDLFAASDVFKTDYVRYYSRDRFHPSADGYAVWFEEVKKIVVERKDVVYEL